MFRKRHNLGEEIKLTPEILMNRFRDEWVDFRCWQNGEMMEIYQEAIGKTNGRARLCAYSAYQRKNKKRANYGMDWRYWAKYCDLVMCGYGRGDYEATRAVIGAGKNTCAGLAAWSSEEHSPQLTEEKAFRRITDLGGIMFFYAGMTDGRSWKGISRATTVVADFKEFFPPQRADHLAVSPAMNGSLTEVSVLTNGEERLVFVFNETEKPITISFANKDLPADAVGIDYWSKKVILHPDTITVNVSPHRVRMFYLFRKNKLKSVRFAPTPIAPNVEHPPRSLRPVFVWSDSSRICRYTVEYREMNHNHSNALSVKATVTITNLPETVCQAQAELISGQSYEWRVRSEDVVSGTKMSGLVWQSFTVPSIFNADVIPRIVAPGAPLRLQADVEIDGDWSVLVKNSDGVTLMSFDGKGHTIALESNAENQELGALPEGQYVAVFLASKGPAVDVPFEVDQHRGSSNPSIENLGPWRVVEWGAYYPDEPNPSDRDYKVSCSGSYSLRIRKNIIKTHAPYWSNFRLEPLGARLPKVNAGETYRFTVRVKTKGSGLRAVATIGFLDETKHRIKGKSAVVTGEHDWQELTITCPVPIGAVRLILNLNCNGGGEGTAWFDEFNLEKL